MISHGHRTNERNIEILKFEINIVLLQVQYLI